MIIYLQHHAIDREKWDACIMGSRNSLVYAMSWYLDITGPGWDALVEEDYSAVFPLVHRSKGGINYLYQPFFTQQLGVFSKQPISGERIKQFISAIPGKFLFAEIHLNTQNHPDPGPFELNERLNHELDLLPAYEILSGNYSENTRRNLKKAAGHPLVLKNDLEPDELITLFRENFGKKEGKLKSEHYEILRILLYGCMKHTSSTISGVINKDGILCASAFFLTFNKRVIYHFAASAAPARENGAMFFLVDRFIREHAGQQLVLDFEGSNDANVARFYKGFGSAESSYPLVRIDHLPAFLRKGVYFMKKFRG